MVLGAARRLVVLVGGGIRIDLVLRCRSGVSAESFVGVRA
jgi:hypothetical protein